MSTEVAKRLFNVTEYYRMGDIGILSEDDGIELLEGKLYDKNSGEKRRFNRDEYQRMIEAGILMEGDRVELIEGEIIKMSAMGTRHAECVDRLLDDLINQGVNRVARIRVQNPIGIKDHSEPEPDIALLRRKAGFYAQAHPTPADVLLLIEVCDSTVKYDREVKVPLYTKAGIPEVWLVILPEDVVEVYAQPVNGVYQEARKARRSESIVAGLVPNLTLSVDAILG